MFKKFKNFPYQNILNQFKDIRFNGFIAFGVLVLLVSWSGVSVIEANYELQKQVSKLEQQNKVSELENQNLKLRNEYYKSNQYLELTARRQFGKGKPGETLLLVPKNIALQHAAPRQEKDIQLKSAPHIRKPFWQTNLEAWIDFFSHRGSI